MAGLRAAPGAPLVIAVVRYAGLALFFALWTAWSIWLLVLLWRRAPPFMTFG